MIKNTYEQILNIPPDLAPDFIIVNARVITVDSIFSMAEAIAVKKERIAAVGTTANMLKLKGKSTRILDLNGATVLPGINEAHGHLASFGETRPPAMLDLTFPNVNSMADIARQIADQVNKVKTGEWIRGNGWDEGYLEECKTNPGIRHPVKEDIDKVSPQNPVILGDFSFHNLLANSQAIQLAGITKNTPDPAGGKIVRDPNTGEPTGLFIEKAKALVESKVPPLSRERRLTAVEGAINDLSRIGVTSVTDGFVSPELAKLYCDGYRKLQDENKWKIRLNMLLNWSGYGLPSSLEDFKQAFRYIQLMSGFGDDFLRIGGVKLFADGLPTTKTAWMFDEYAGGGFGGLIIKGDTPEKQRQELIDIIGLINRNGYQAGIHCTGDRAANAIIEGIAKALDEYPWDARHYIIHGDYIRPQDMASMVKYNIGVTTQIQIMSQTIEFSRNVLGIDKAENQWPLGSFFQSGVRVVQSSDMPVVYPDWKQGIQNCILRESKASGRAYGKQHCIPIEEAIRQYTINGAYQDHQEKIKGSIEAGKLADFCVIDKDILKVDPHKIGEAKTLMTILGGKVVYSAEPNELDL
jgi:predicted amidohydrolase YtcJ